MTRIAVLDDWQYAAKSSAEWSPLEARADVRFFREPFAGEDEAVRALADFDIVLATRERTPFPRSLVERLPRLRMFGMTGARAGLIDIAALQARGVTVCCTGGGPSGHSTAEIALGLMLAAARRIPQGDAAVRAGRFQLGTQAGFVLAGRTIGLIGLGRIGALMAAYCNALGMRVLAWSPNLTDERAKAANAMRMARDELLAASDVVSLHLVLSERTRGTLAASDLARMKRGAILVNTARAALVDEKALIDAVTSGRIFAALDVFHREPLPRDDPLVSSANTVLTPHLGYSALDVYAEYYSQLVENALAFLDSRPIRCARQGDAPALNDDGGRMLKIFGHAASSNVQKVLWCAGELALPFERRDLGGTFGGNKTPEYLALNPNGLVPTIDDDGLILWESNAIVRYLAAKHGAGSLCPTDLRVRADADRWMDWQQTTLASPLGVLFRALLRKPAESVAADALDTARDKASKAFAMLDRALDSHAYVAGDALTIGDIALGNAIHRWNRLPIERPDLPRLDAWYARLRERPAYAKYIASF